MRDYDEIERMAKTFRLSSAEVALLVNALYEAERVAKRESARCSKGDDANESSRLQRVAECSRLLRARLNGSICGGGYAFTEI